MDEFKIRHDAQAAGRGARHAGPQFADSGLLLDERVPKFPAFVLPFRAVDNLGEMIRRDAQREG